MLNVLNPLFYRLQYPKKAANTFEADSHQKIIMKFQLKDKTNVKSVSAHQVSDIATKAFRMKLNTLVSNHFHSLQRFFIFISQLT
jgi:glycogen synthase